MPDEEEVIEKLCKCIIDGDEEGAIEASHKIIKINQKIDINKKIPLVYQHSMEVVSMLFERRKIFIPEMLLSANAANSSLKILESYFSNNNIKAKNRGKVVLGVISGDFHDIGKNIVKIMLQTAGFEVHDLGTDTSPQKFLDKSQEVDADIVGVSALMTTTMENMIDVVNLFLEKKEDTKVMIGGAPITSDFAYRIGADGYADDAAKAVKLAEKLIIDRKKHILKGKRKIKSYDRVITTLEHDEPDTVPTASPFQGYWALDHARISVSKSIKDPRLAATLQIKEVKKSGFDAFENMWDWLAPVEAIGGEVKIESKGNPVTIKPLLKKSHDIDNLELPDIMENERIRAAVETFVLISQLNRNEKFSYATVVMPFTLAGEIRGTQNLMMDIYKDRQSTLKLLDFCATVVKGFSQILIEKGVECIHFCDPVASGELISSEAFQEFSLPYIKDVLNYCSKRNIYSAIHICGDINDRLVLFNELRTNILSIDSNVNLKFAREKINQNLILLGNISPLETLYMGRPEDVRSQARSCIEKMGKREYILAGGCDITVGTPLQNLRTLTLTPNEFL
ncbi:MAG: uroporphyrinogen decarboxylase family protein [Candidatus Methanofastidiosia archaeon]